MSRNSIGLSDELNQYVVDISVHEPDLLARLRKETAELPEAGMQVAPEQGQLLTLLVRLMAARKILEVGVFTGYSSLAMALALPDDGSLIACDVSEDWTSVARRYWQEAGVAQRIDLRLGPALDTLNELIETGHGDSFDMAFIDADKERYIDYFERALVLLRPGGLIAVDNVLWSGSVLDPTDQSADTVAIREFNQHLYDDQRIDLSLLPIGDGLTLARKR